MCFKQYFQRRRLIRVSLKEKQSSEVTFERIIKISIKIIIWKIRNTFSEK